MEPKTVTLNLELLDETWQLIQALAAEHGWPPEEAILTLVGYGIGYVQGGRYLNARTADQQRFVERLNLLESQYAVMKFRAFALQRDNQRLELREVGAQHAASLADAVLLPLQEERKAWRSQKHALEAEMERLRTRLAELTADGTDVDRIGSRLTRWKRGR